MGTETKEFDDVETLARKLNEAGGWPRWEISGDTSLKLEIGDGLYKQALEIVERTLTPDAPVCVPPWHSYDVNGVSELSHYMGHARNDEPDMLKLTARDIASLNQAVSYLTTVIQPTLRASMRGIALSEPVQTAMFRNKNIRSNAEIDDALVRFSDSNLTGVFACASNTPFEERFDARLRLNDATKGRTVGESLADPNFPEPIRRFLLEYVPVLNDPEVAAAINPDSAPETPQARPAPQT